MQLRCKASTAHHLLAMKLNWWATGPSTKPMAPVPPMAKPAEPPSTSWAAASPVGQHDAGPPAPMPWQPTNPMAPPLIGHSNPVPLAMKPSTSSPTAKPSSSPTPSRLRIHRLPPQRMPHFRAASPLVIASTPPLIPSMSATPSSPRTSPSTVMAMAGTPQSNKRATTSPAS